MCLSIPAKVISIDGEMAKVSVNGVIANISLQLVDEVKIGEYVLVHTGYALQKLTFEEADEALGNYRILNNAKE